MYCAWRTDKILVGIPHRKRPLGSPRHRGDDNIDLRVIECEDVNWID